MSWGIFDATPMAKPFFLLAININLEPVGWVELLVDFIALGEVEAGNNLDSWAGDVNSVTPFEFVPKPGE